MKCFFDLDDVLVDTSKAVLTHHGFNPDILKEPQNIGHRNLHKMVNMEWVDFWYKLSTEFWATLPKTPWADGLVEEGIKFFGIENVYFLTSPIRTAACAGGKMEWVNKNYPKIVENLVIAHPKWDLVDKESILIDDSYSNEEEFIKRGKRKQFYLFPSLQNKKHELIELYEQAPDIAVFHINQIFKGLIK